MVSVSKIGSIIKISNDLARAYWPTKGVWEFRLITALAALVKSTDEDFHTYKIPLSELGASFSFSRNYSDIKNAIETLIGKALKISTKSSKDFVYYNIFSVCGIQDGCFIARFTPELKPFFLNLQREYTLYHSLDIMKLPSSYDQKFFVLLKSWSGRPNVTISLSELHVYLDTTPSLRKTYGNFKQRVLIPCHRHICDYTQIHYDFEEILHGRSVYAIKFIFKNTKNNEKTGYLNDSIFQEMLTCKKENPRCFESQGAEKCAYCLNSHKK